MIERATTSEQVHEAAHLFDDAVRDDAVRRFLDDPTHHLLLARDDEGQVVGFVSGVETTHPDKGTEMFLYELAVAAQAQDPRALAQELCLVMEGTYVTRQVTGNKRTVDIARRIAKLVVDKSCPRLPADVT